MAAKRSLKDTRIHLLKPGSVLIVDDDPDFRSEIRDILTKDGYEAVCLESANHAIRYMQGQPWNWYPWLLITDLVMDGMGGYQLMRRVSEIYPNRTIPMLVTSRLGSPDDIVEAEQAGASAYLRKPIKYDELRTAISHATEKKKKSIQLKMEHKDI